MNRSDYIEQSSNHFAGEGRPFDRFIAPRRFSLGGRGSNLSKHRLGIAQMLMAVSL